MKVNATTDNRIIWGNPISLFRSIIPHFCDFQKVWGWIFPLTPWGILGFWAIEENDSLRFSLPSTFLVPLSHVDVWGGSMKILSLLSTTKGRNNNTIWTFPFISNMSSTKTLAEQTEQPQDKLLTAVESSFLLAPHPRNNWLKWIHIVW